MSYIQLSYTIDEHTPLYGSTPPPVIRRHRSIPDGASSNTFMITMHNHIGTHIDAPGHFIEGGRTISDYDLKDLIFHKPVIIACSAGVDERIHLREAASGIEGIDCILVNTGFAERRHEDIYRTHNPWFASEDIEWLRKNHSSVRCIGVDTISISGFQHREEGREAHRAAFRDMIGCEPLLLIEDMNLAHISHMIIRKLFVLPLMIKGIDSAPCNVIAEVEPENE